jgi:hypothetical protein
VVREALLLRPALEPPPKYAAALVDTSEPKRSSDTAYQKLR